MVTMTVVYKLQTTTLYLVLVEHDKCTQESVRDYDEACEC